MVPETRALRPLASSRWILKTMNYSGGEINQGLVIKDERCYLISACRRTVIDSEIGRHSDLLGEVLHSLCAHVNNDTLGFGKGDAHSSRKRLIQ
jgi:hypothetical protein